MIVIIVKYVFFKFFHHEKLIQKIVYKWLSLLNWIRIELEL